MDTNILGYFIMCFPTIGYVIYTFVSHQENTGIDYTKILYTVIITTVSVAIGRQMISKNDNA